VLTTDALAAVRSSSSSGRVAGTAPTITSVREQYEVGAC
jgi:hypothetical protein